MVEPKDISELEDLHWGEFKKHHSLRRRKSYVFVEGNEVQYLLISQDVTIHLVQETLYGEQFIDIVLLRVLDALTYIRREPLIELVEASIGYLSLLQTLYDSAF